MASTPVPATEGSTYTNRRGDEFTVGPKCDMNQGNWVCTTHGGVGFVNELAKGDHYRNNQGECVMAWNCHQHGPEVP